jgi:putative ABC transport system permease protein
MPVLYRASFGYLLRHPWQLGLALLGICVGVGVIVAIDLAIESSRNAFLLSMDTLTGRATHQVIGGPRGVNEKLYARLRVDEGIRSIAPVVTGEILIDEARMQVLGVDPFAESQIRPFSFDVQAGPGESGPSAESLFGSLLTEPGAALMSRQTARSLNLEPGDGFEVAVGARTHPGRLLGFIGDNPALQNLVVVDIAVAQNWLGQAGWLSRIDVRIPADAPALKEKVESVLPAGTQLLSAQGRTRSLAEMSRAFMTNLSAMSLLALLVGLFLIYNSVSFAVLQRRRLIGVLRALGVTRGQVFGLIMAEGAILGLLGAAIGVTLGIWLGEQLLVLISRSINDLYFRLSVTGVTISGISVAKGLLAGLGATLAAAAIPAFEASSYRPRLALTRSVLENRNRRLLPLMAGAGLALCGVAILFLNLSGSSLEAGLTAVFMLILGFALCIPLAVRTIATSLAALAFRLGGTSARLAVSDIAANLSRTGVAIVALAVAVSATIGVSVMVGSFRESVSTWLDDTLQSDLYIATRGAGLDDRFIEEIARIPGVEAYSTSRRAWLEDEADRIRLIAVRMPAGIHPGSELLDASPEQAWAAFDRQDAILVSEPFAYHHAVGAGDSIELITDSGPRGFTIAATYRSYDVNGGSVLISRNTYDRFWNDPGVDSMGLFLAPAVTAGEILQQLEGPGADRQQLVVRSNREIRELSLAVFDRTFIITDVLYWLATGVALIGILSAMLALQMERSRELAVLRALGMTPAQLGGMITTQTATIGLFSGLFAVPLGLVMAWVLIAVINRRAFGWQMDILVSWSGLLEAVLFSVAAALVAGIYPAWRATRSRPALAMREE